MIAYVKEINVFKKSNFVFKKCNPITVFRDRLLKQALPLEISSPTPPSKVSHNNEPPHQKPNNLHYAKAQVQITCAVAAQLISAFDFASRIVPFLYYLYPKFHVSSQLL